MEKFVRYTGVVAPLDLENVDTDRIIPKQFLKRLTKVGYEDALFFEHRFNDDGSLNNEFEFNNEKYRGASILVSRKNFGCGSSREHAVWALKDYGIKTIIAQSFSDIFYANCFNNAVLPINLDCRDVDDIFQDVRSGNGYTMNVDLFNQVVGGVKKRFKFKLDAVRKRTLIEGLDMIDLTMESLDKIEEYEKSRVMF